MSSPFHFSDQQIRTIEITERVGSVLSLAGCTWIFTTFLLSTKFRKPINRLIFYAAIGNTFCNIATLISQDGIRAAAVSPNSGLCQFQAFLIQMFLPADAMWNLAMAINVYLTVFKDYSAKQLRRLEPIYLLINYGVTFVPALAYIFISTRQLGRVYGPALTWCSITSNWGFLRIALCYGPAWITILITFLIYVWAGREIFEKKCAIRASKEPASEVIIIPNPFLTSYVTTEVKITSEVNPHGRRSQGQLFRLEDDDPSDSFEPYTVTVGRGMKRPISPIVQSVHPRRQTSTLDANTAAWGYLKCAMLFFVSLLITWVPSSANRVHSLLYPHDISFSYNYAGGLVLPLMGFWNSVIYTATSWDAVQSLFADSRSPCGGLFGPSLRGRVGRPQTLGLEMGRPTSLGSRERDSHLPVIGRGSSTDSIKRLAL
ncbi:hypothetical protein MMC13_004097 [Lambiella insularis]|nr:hypothetical protein [Lambiella insularis]